MQTADPAKSAQSPEEQQIIYLSTLLQLEKQIRHAATARELGFIMVNETLRLIQYRQAIMWRMGPTGRITIEAASGVDRPDRNAPYILFVRELIRYLTGQSDHRSIHPVSMDGVPERLSRNWQESEMGTGLWCPLVAPSGELLGGLLITRNDAWSDAETALMNRLTDAYAHAWWALQGRSGRLHGQLLTGLRKRWVKWAGLALITGAMFLPVRLSVLAPVEIVPRDPHIVTAPMDGVIARIEVEPNQEVNAGQPLFRLEDTRIRNEFELSRKALAVVQAEYQRTRQKAFLDRESKADLLLLESRIEQKTAEVNYMADLLDRSRIPAEKAGLVIFGEVSDWIGRPVVVGEKVMTIADPSRIEAEIQLPVEDAITLDTGAEVLIFLNVRPDAPLKAHLRRTSYDAAITATGVLAFRLKAAPSDPEAPPRIGLRGTAKIYGKPVSLFYYLMRRPMAALRQWMGV